MRNFADPITATSAAEREAPSFSEPASGPPADTSGSNLESALRDTTRLEALVETRLLDTPPEESFDRLTRLAAKLIGVPATFISLVDQNRDYYKSCFGFGEPLATARQLEGRTFCHYALVSSGPLLISDTMEDAVFREVPTVQSLGVRAYAGIPLMTDAGQAIGSFCAIDFAPREWSPLDVEILTELAASAMREIKLRSAVLEAETQTRAAQEATRSREEVLAVVAHDLRTPLNFIKMGAQLVAETSDATENGETLERIKGAVDLMDLLIQDLLEVAKIEAGQMSIRPQPIPPETLLQDALSILAPLAQRHDIRLLSTAESNLPPVLADYERILRVFSNLIVNAVKFSLAGSVVRVNATRAETGVRFSVLDSGSGIPADQLMRIFDRFWQVNASDARGVGLGLALAKSIVTAHGGTIGVSSNLGQGSDFYFELPIALNPAVP